MKLDPHTYLTLLLVAGIILLAALGKIDGSEALAVLIAAVSPGFVMQKKEEEP